MPMAVSPSKKHLYAVVRSQPVRVLTFAIDPATGALTQKASAPLPDSMPYVSTDHTGRFLFTASYGGDKIAVSPIGENGLVEAEAIQVIPTGRNAHSILPDPQQQVRLRGHTRRQPGAAVHLRQQDRQAHGQ